MNAHCLDRLASHRIACGVCRAALALAVAGLAAGVIGCRQRAAPTGDSHQSQPAEATTADRAAAKSPAAPTSARRTVELVIDFGDGAEKRFTELPWRENMTVLDVLEAAKAHPHGITFAVRGSGDRTLLTQLDGVANQRGAAGAKNWIFYVNGRKAARSAGAKTVKSGATILWKFEAYE